MPSVQATQMGRDRRKMSSVQYFQFPSNVLSPGPREVQPSWQTAPLRVANAPQASRACPSSLRLCERQTQQHSLAPKIRPSRSQKNNCSQLVLTPAICVFQFQLSDVKRPESAARKDWTMRLLRTTVHPAPLHPPTLQDNAPLCLWLDYQCQDWAQHLKEDLFLT
jgi:hypothetical protein